MPWIPHPITVRELTDASPNPTSRPTPKGKITSIIPEEVKNIYTQILSRKFLTIAIFLSAYKTALCAEKKCGMTCGVSPFGLRYCVDGFDGLSCVLQPEPPRCAGKYF